MRTAIVLLITLLLAMCTAQAIVKTVDLQRAKALEEVAE